MLSGNQGPGKNKWYFFLIALPFLFSPSLLWSNEQNHSVIVNNYPIPPENNGKRLFYIQRSNNSNTIVYEANLDADNKLDPNNPVNVFWRRYNTDGKKKPLKWFENAFAFGIESEAVKKGGFLINLVSYRKRKGHLYQNETGKIIFEGKLANKKVMLSHAFIQTDNGDALIPIIYYIDVSGIEIETNKPITERIIVTPVENNP